MSSRSGSSGLTAGSCSANSSSSPIGRGVVPGGIRPGLAYVPGELRLPERLTGRQFQRSIGRLRARFEAGRIDELAERFTLDLDRPIRQLSSGNRRKVSVLGAFLSDATC